jgi:L-fucose isomerase-like protein
MRIGFVSFSWTGGFDGGFAVDKMNATIALLSRFGEVIAPDHPICTVEEAQKVAALLEAGRVDALILQQGTFCSAEPLPVVVERIQAPIAVWAVREPYNGGRVVANSLVGINLMASVLTNLDRPYRYFYGDPDEAPVIHEVETFLTAARTVRKLKTTRVGLAGSRAPGFYLMGADDMALRRQVGPEILHIDLSELFYGPEPSPEEIAAVKAGLAQRVANAEAQAPENMYKVARAIARLRQLVRQNGLTCVALKNWPEFDPGYGVAADAVLSVLTSEGIVAGCEGDLNGTITGVMLQEASGGGLTFLTDMVQVDQQANTGILWHAGVAPMEMAADGQQINFSDVGSVGMNLEFVLKPGRITIARLGIIKGRYRLLVTGGESLPTEMIVRGAMTVVKFDAPARQVLDTILLGGWEHHVSMVYGDVQDELVEVARQLGIEAVRI